MEKIKETIVHMIESIQDEHIIRIIYKFIKNLIEG